MENLVAVVNVDWSAQLNELPRGRGFGPSPTNPFSVRSCNFSWMNNRSLLAFKVLKGSKT